MKRARSVSQMCSLLSEQLADLPVAIMQEREREKEKAALSAIREYARTLSIVADECGVSVQSYTDIQPPKDTRLTWVQLVGARESVSETPWTAAQAFAITEALRQTANYMEALAERLRLDEIRR